MVTAGAQEARFVALAGARELAGAHSGSRALLLPGAPDFEGTYAACRALDLHPEPLLEVPESWPAGVGVVLGAESAARASSAGPPGEPLLVVDLGALSDDSLEVGKLPETAVFLGSLDGFDDLAPFRVGFLRAPAALVGVLRRWKQALSICTPAPSQRAAALRLGARPAAIPPPPKRKHLPDDDSRYSLLELAARLDDVVSLGRGDPDADAPAAVIEAACDRLGDREPLDPRGQRWLREAVAEREEERTGIRWDPASEVLVTGGAQQGIAAAVLALVGEGEDLLLGDPYYTSYGQAAALARGRLQPVACGGGRLGDAEDFGLTAAATEDAFRKAARPRLLAIVNFQNPTGARTRAAEVEGLARLVDREHLWLLSDEVYADMALDGKGPVLSPSTLPGMRRRTLTLGSVSKSYAMTGFRVGYLTGPADAIGACARVQGALSGPVALFSQRAAEAALRGGGAFPAALRAIYAPRRRRLLDGLRKLGMAPAAHGGGFFVWADVSRFGLDAPEFCRRLLLEARVLMFPGTAFGARWTRHTRVSMLASEARIEEALARLRTFTARLGA